MPLIAFAVVCWAAVALGLRLGWLGAGPGGSALPEGGGVFAAVALSDPLAGSFDTRVLVRLSEHDADVVARFDHVPDLAAGERLRLEGVLTENPVSFRGKPTSGELKGARLVHSLPPASPLRRAANASRARMIERLNPAASPPRALLAGFLVGDTSFLPAVESESLRRAGLSHFVAVSGSNVALFLAAWWLVFTPLAVVPQLRWALGLVGIAFFAIVTRGEPSVIRASAMAGIALIGRAAGVPMDAWSVLSLSVVGSLFAVPRFATDVGFGLSVAATSGVLVGSSWFSFRPRPVATLLGASLGAQIAVAPILIAVFGSLPLFSPFANLFAAPLVTLATGSGGVGAVLGWDWLVGVGAGLARLVMGIARVASPWPQVGWSALFAALGAGGLVLLRPALRPLLAPTAAALVLVGAGASGISVDRPAVVFLDVGQGDAAVVLGETATVLIDGGPDPVLLDRALARYRVHRVDVVIATHVHADHLGGLAALPGRYPVGQLWVSFGPHSTPTSEALLEMEFPTVVPTPGTRVVVGDLGIEVLGPSRRYESPNDQSLVIMVDVGGRRFLFPGDVEVHAQRDLGVLDHDVLKVPHQGAATSDRDWLAANAGTAAVISVGENSFGHPADWVIETLLRAGAEVLRTDEGGDVIFEAGGIRRRAGRRRRYA